MEVRGRSRKNKGRANARRRIRALMSMVLTAAMMMGNMAASVNTILAATPAPREEFRLHAEAIQKAVEKALDEGSAVTKEILIDGKDKSVVKEYEKMFAADGKLYELDLMKEIETVKQADGIDLRIFMRLPEEADPNTHVLNGEEELYFVYVNYGEESVSARLNIDGLISGFNTIRPYEAVFGENEIQDETGAGAGNAAGGAGAGSAGGGAGTGNDGNAADEAADEAETVNKGEADAGEETEAEKEEASEGESAGGEIEGENPEEEGEVSAGNEENNENESREEIDKSEDKLEDNDSTDSANTTDDIDKETADKAENAGHPTSGESSSTAGDDKQEANDSVSDAGQENSSAVEDGEDKGSSSAASAGEDKENNSSAADNGDSTSKTESNQESGKSEGKSDDSSSDSGSSEDKAEAKSSENSQAKEVSLNSLQISFHQILRVAEPDGTSEAETEETEDVVEETEEYTEEETDEETEAIIEETEEESRIEEILETETEAETAVTDEAETNEETTAEIKETETAVEVSAEVKEETAVVPGNPEINEEITEEDEGIEAGAEKEEDPFKKKGVLEGKILNLVSFEDGLTARAFTTTLGKLGMSKEDLTEGGHILTYTISPVGSAIVVNAPELVRDEAEVIFGVMPQIGYRIAGVTANGVHLETVDGSVLETHSNAEKLVASTSNGNKDVEYNEEEIVYFIIPEILEDQAIDIVMTEEGEWEHPKFEESVTMHDGVTITVSAEEGILPIGTYLEVEEVTEKVADAVRENIKAEKKEELQTIMAYDINLMLDGKKLNNNYWSGKYVNVEFSGEKIEQIKENYDKVEIAPLETPTKTVEAALGQTEEVAVLDNIEAKDIQVNEAEIKTIYLDDDGSADKIEYQAEHFTVYVVSATTGSELERLGDNGKANFYEKDTAGNITINGETFLWDSASDVNFKCGGNSKGTYHVALNAISFSETKDVQKVYYSDDGRTFTEVTSFDVIISIGKKETNDTWWPVEQPTKKVEVKAILKNNSESPVFSSREYFDKNQGADRWDVIDDIQQHENFYWIVNRPENSHKVKWYVDGQLDKVAYVENGAKPSYGSSGPTKIAVDNKAATFEGWATEPNSKDFKLEADLPEVTEDITYYAVFTYKALFYFVLEGKSNTSTKQEDYMFAGPDYGNNPTNLVYGKVIVPDGFESGSRWYVNSDEIKDMNDLIIVSTTDAAIRRGLQKAYPSEYNNNWLYSIDWTTLSYATSVGYDKNTTITNDKVLHVDGAVILNRTGKIGLQYHVVQPDGSVITQSKTHTKNEIEAGISINETIINGNPTYTTDGYDYDATKVHQNTQYYFDGWYLNLACTIPAPNVYQDLKVQTFYARYLANDKLTYNPNGGAEDAYVAWGAPNSNLTVDDNTFTRPGYQFTGWNTMADGSGTAYKPGDNYTLTSAADVLYAQWQQIIGSFSVKKILRDGTNFASASVNDVQFQLYETDADWSTDASVYKAFGGVVTVSGIQTVEGKNKFGIFEFKDLPLGYYYLHEVQTTSGYKVLENDIKIEISDDGNGNIASYYYDNGTKTLISKNGFEVTNDPAYAAILPDTGGPGLGLIKEFGWVLLLLALMMAGIEVQYYGERRRRIRADEMRMDERRYEEL